MGFLGSKQQMGVAAVLLAASAFLSRLMGLVRDKIISWQFGAGNEADLYFAAFVVPDIINYLLAGAFLSITIMPILAKGFGEDAESTWRFFSCVFIWMSILSILFTLTGEIWAEKLAILVAPGFDAPKLERLAYFMRLVLPAQIFFLSGSCFTALLLLKRQFVVPSLAPLIYNGFIILCGVLLPLLPTVRPNYGFGMTGYCIGVSVGAFFGAFALPVLVAWQGGIRIYPAFHHPWMRRFLTIALPLMFGQTVVMLDEQFMRVFGSMLGEGQISLLNYGRRIAQVPIALMGQAAAVASYPFLVQLLARNEREKFSSSLRTAMTTATVLIIPCVMLMMACARPILEVIFQGGRFGAAETLACLPLTRILLSAAPLWIIYMILVRAFYAHEDTLTPAITGTLVTLPCIPLYLYWAVPQGAWAIAAVSGLGVGAYLLWLAKIWIRREGKSAFRGLLKNACLAFFISLPGTLCAWPISDYLFTSSRFFAPFLLALFKLLLASCAFFIITIIILAVFKPEILKIIINKLKGKLLRKEAD